LLGELRRRRFDLVFDLQGLLRTGLMTLATGAPLRVGLETAREGAQLACNCVIPDTGWFAAAHARYARVVKAIGPGGIRWPTVVGISEADRQWACRQLAGPGGLRVAVHAGATWPTKQWPLARFAAIAGRARSKYEATIVLVGGKNEVPLAQEIETALRPTQASGRVLNLTGQSSLKQLAALLSKVDLLVTNDSGPMHLAAGLGTPVLGIFTCTSPHRSGPPGDNHELVATQVACAASYRKRCPHRGPLHQCCHQELDALRVWQALERLVAKHRLSRHAA
jgi:ADP-heptose:LPS heptosyltransferase